MNMMVVIYALAVALTTSGAPLAADDVELRDAMQEFVRAAEEWSRNVPNGDDDDVDDLDEEKLWRLSMRLMDDSSENQRESWGEWEKAARKNLAKFNENLNKALGPPKCDEEGLKLKSNQNRCKIDKLYGLLKKN